MRIKAASAPILINYPHSPPFCLSLETTFYAVDVGQNVSLAHCVIRVTDDPSVILLVHFDI